MNNKVKSMQAMQSNSLREIVDFANSKGISKDDVVGLFPASEGYCLIYYK